MKTVKPAASTEPTTEQSVDVPTARVPWAPWLGVLVVLLVYLLSQIFGSLIVSIYPLLRHWTASYANNWLQNNITAEFIYILLAESLTVGGIYLFIRHYKRTLRVIGLVRPRWRDPLFGLLAIPIYFIVFAIAAGILSSMVHGFNVNQQQQIGFDNVHGALQLTLTGISLVVLPPIAEEIMVRGLLYSSLKKWMPRIWAVLLTSALFASAHLPEGGAAGPLWIGALDTFILSLFLIYLREKTKSLWAGITMHALKNGVAYYALYLAPLVHWHL